MGAKTSPPSSLREKLFSERSRIQEHLQRYGASNARVFGSVARGDDQEGSDIDLLIDLPRNKRGRSQLLGALTLSTELSELTGLSIDVSTEDLLAPEVRAAALRDAVAL